MSSRQLFRSLLTIGILLGCSIGVYAQGAITATPSSLNLDTTTGPDITQTVTLKTTSATAVPFTVNAGSTSWLSVSPVSGSVVAGSPFALTVHANSVGLPPSDYSASFQIKVGDQVALEVSVTYHVVVVTGLTASPPQISWTYSPGGSSPSPQVVTLSSSASTFNATVPFDSPWLLLGIPNPPQNFVPTSQLNGYPTAGGFTLVFQPNAGLAPGTVYNGRVTVTDGNGNTTQVGVTLSVTGVSNGFNLSPGAVTLTTSGGSVTTILNSTAPNPTAFTATANVTTPPGGTWLTVTPSATTPQNLVVTANPTGLPAGTYTGSITGLANGLSSVVQVTFVVNTGAGGGGNITSDQTALTISYQSGQTLPAAKNIVISSQTAGTSVPFTVSATVPAGTVSWLTAGIRGGGLQGITGTATGTVVVNVNPQSLPPGIYSGTVTVTPSGGNALIIPVTLQVSALSTVSASPLQLTFAYQAGATNPPTQAIQVVGNAPSLAYTVVTTTTSNGTWLSAGTSGGTTPATANTPVALNVTVNPNGLATGVYTGTITVAGTGAATGTTNIAVTLTITAPLPSITSVQHGASFLTGQVAPGEIVSIFGTLLGPAVPVGTTIDSTTGKVSTSIGGVQVLFSGTPAPLIYVSPIQINCVAPYEIATVTGPYVQVKYLGQGSNTFNLQLANTAPGIFAASAGVGQGAILNSDNSTNGPVGTGTKPAAAGSVVQVFMTGEGQIVPAGVTGSVTCSAGCATTAQIPKPALAVGALVNNQPATVAFYSEAPNFVSGVMQVNVIIPPGTPSGPVPISISVGGNSSQPGVTVYVQ